MTKKQKMTVIEKMRETVGYIRDAEKNADAFYSAETIKMNMNNYFTGLAFALETATGNEYHYSHNESGWAVVEIADKKEIRYPVQ